MPYWLAPHDSLSLLSYTTQDHLPRDGTTHGGLGPSTSTVNQKKNAPTDLPMGQYDGGTILSSEFLFPEISRFVSS